NDITGAAHDGIHVSGTSDVTIGGDDEEDGNYVTGAGNDGIHVENGGTVGITGNTVTGSEGFLFGAGRDGIHIEDSSNVAIGGYGEGAGNTITDVGNDGIFVDPSSHITVVGNTINGAYDGVHFDYVTDGLIDSNTISNVYNGVMDFSGETVSILDNTISGGEGRGTGIGVYDGNHTVVASTGEGVQTVQGFYNGIQVEYSYDTDILGNVLTDIRNDGIQVRDGKYAPDPEDLDAHDGFNTRINGNSITGAGGDGIQIVYGRDILINGNTLDGNYNGIHLGDDEEGGDKNERNTDDFFITSVSFGETGGSDNVVITNNTISNSKNAGLYAMAPDNGSIVIAGNDFTGNPVGAWIGSGLIDLTGDVLMNEDLTPGRPNTFTGGDVALRFERASYQAPFFQPYEMPEYETSYADLQLVRDTLGDIQFTGQSTYYVELLNGAFFEPGNPTIIDGTLATYDLVNGGLMTAAQLAAIEDKINDYDDDRTLGQIFVGFTPDDNMHVFGKAMGFRFRPGRAGIVITGLPHLPGQGGGPRAFTAQELAGLEPAAGGDDKGDNKGSGGNTVTAPCWSQAIGLLNGRNVIDVDLNQDDETKAAASARACRGAI
ncbi:MAG: right-handed parallel beta-helix repeat-containing protein, partial [Pseudomonadota bacterium]